MTARVIGLAAGNGRFQDELGDALAPLLPIERCRTDRDLLMLVAQHALGGAIVGQDLLGLHRHVLPALVRHDIPTLLVAPERDIPRLQAALAMDASLARVRLLPVSAEPSRMVAVLEELRRGASEPTVVRTGPYVVEAPRAAPPAPGQSGRGSVYALVGTGGDGCTTLVANLLLALGAARDVVGVDLDPVAPLLVSLLNADPSLGLDGVIRAQAAGVASLERAVEANLQPAPQARRAPHALLLGGLPLHGGPRPRLSVELVDQLLALLAERGSLVLVDVGRLLPATERLGLLQRSVLAAANGVFVVSGADRPGVLRTCDAVAQLLPTADVASTPPAVPLERLALVLNRYDPALLDPPAEIAAQIGLPLVGCVADDDKAMRRAVYEHEPVVLGRAGRAARDLLGLADALAAGDWPPRVSTQRSVSARLAQLTVASRLGLIASWRWLAQLRWRAWRHARTRGHPAAAAPSARSARAETRHRQRRAESESRRTGPGPTRRGATVASTTEGGS